jgi:inosine-uridine nucleoside N-ribohydrolase
LLTKLTALLAAQALVPCNVASIVSMGGALRVGIAWTYVAMMYGL